MTTDVDIVNAALTFLGSTRINTLADSVKAAREANAIYEITRDSMLAGFNWSFAMKRASVPISQSGPAYGFDAAYDYPDDCLRAVLVNERWVGLDMTDYRGGPLEDFVIEGRQILMNNGGSFSGTNLGKKVASIAVTYEGFAYKLAPAITIAPPPSGTQATATSRMGVFTFIENNFGAGFVAGEKVTMVGGTYDVPAVGLAPYTGPATDFQPVVHGEYTILPGGTGTDVAGTGCTGPNNFTGGSGGGLQKYCIWGLTKVVITNAGNGYINPPVVTVANPTGSKGIVATATATLEETLQWTGPDILLRYVKKSTDPNEWSANFKKALAFQLAADLAEPLSQSPGKRDRALVQLRDELNRAIKANAIELPPRGAPDAEWMMSRL